MSTDTSITNTTSHPLVEYSPNAVLVIDDMRITYANEAAGHVFHTAVSDLMTFTLSDLNQSEEAVASLISHTQQAAADKTTQQHRIALMSGAGLRQYTATYRPHHSQIHVFLQDISALIQSETALTTQTTHDPLTGLFNRSQLFLMGTQDIARAKRYKHPTSLLVVTISNMRHVNQSYGYAMGDHILINVSRALRDVLRESDYAARLDNNSFVICLLDATLEQTNIVTRRIKTAISGRDILIADTNIPLEMMYGSAEFDSTLDSQFDDFLLRAEKNCTGI
ncbi:diguanylate cyclase domain-containing protein [Neptunomonas sp.]|uniref:sensor domain-containing diguanylate cyclase n=1 Tax=Neptunomonas sp. TaxID=1971898 RepID=UPI003562AF51